MTDLVNFIKTITISEVVIAILAITTLIEAASKTIKPWTELMKFIGRSINHEVIEKLNEQGKQNDKLQDELTGLSERINQKDAEDARNHILRFGDEIKNGVRHSEEYFNQILDDITKYENYCEEHPKFKNEKTAVTEVIIKEVYAKCVRENDFL